jgi:hypothetical protein
MISSAARVVGGRARRFMHRDGLVFSIVPPFSRYAAIEAPAHLGVLRPNRRSERPANVLERIDPVNAVHGCHLAVLSASRRSGPQQSQSPKQFFFHFFQPIAPFILPLPPLRTLILELEPAQQTARELNAGRRNFGPYWSLRAAALDVFRKNPHTQKCASLWFQ